MRNAGLDILRIVAVLLVIGRHIELPENPGTILTTLNRGGWVGVDLFFVLSGFLVSGLLFKEYIQNEQVDIKRFLIRRAFKIYPAFWVFLISTMLLKILFGEPPKLQHIIGEILFLQNYLGGAWNHTWSLAVEEHFYIGLGIIIAYLVSVNQVNPFKNIGIIFLIVAAFCLTLRILKSYYMPYYSHQTHLYGTHIRIDSLMFGVLLSWLVHFKNLENIIARIPSVLLFIGGVVLFSPAFIFQLENTKFIYVY